MGKDKNKILVLGNGFDLFHGYKTKYTDFIQDIITQQQNLEENRKKYRYSKSTEYLDLSNDNCFINYFKAHQKYTDWIDFEHEIEQIVNMFSKIFHHIEMNPYFDNRYNINDLKLTPKEKVMIKHFGELFICPREDEYLTYIILNKGYHSSEGFNKKRALSYLKSQLNDLILALELYLFNNIKPEEASALSLQLSKLDVDFVINFNYTNLCKLYNIEDNNVYFLHGNVRNNLDVGSNNMVLGIKDEAEDDLDFVYFKKYFQRIQKKIKLLNFQNTFGNMFTDDGLYVANDVYFFGHSLSKTDGDIIKQLDSVADQLYIYYCNQFDYEQKVINLIDIFGRDKVVEAIKDERYIFEQIIEYKEKTL